MWIKSSLVGKERRRGAGAEDLSSEYRLCIFWQKTILGEKFSNYFFFGKYPCNRSTNNPDLYSGL